MEKERGRVFGQKGTPASSAVPKGSNPAAHCRAMLRTRSYRLTCPPTLDLLQRSSESNGGESRTASTEPNVAKHGLKLSHHPLQQC
jgi:hypothetical protein